MPPTPRTTPILSANKRRPGPLITAARATTCAGMAREKGTLRSLITASTEILRDSSDETQEAKHLLGQAEQKIFSILDSRSDSAAQTIKDVLHTAIDRLEARLEGRHTTGGVDSGFTDLDNQTSGLH